MKYLLYMMISVVLLSAGTLKRNSNLKVVVDSSNSIMWMDNKDTISLRMSHKKAKPYCEELNYAGFNNWRLPKIEEFKEIVDKENTKNYINKAFRFNKKSGYWASKAHIRTLWFYADYMNFISGTAYYDNRNKNKYVRCVRDIN